MSLDTFYTALRAQLLADTDLSDWASTHFSQAFTVIEGNTPVDMIDPAELPALVFEIDSAELEIHLGGGEQDTQAKLACAVVWNEDNTSDAWTQRLTLPRVFIKAIGLDHTLGNAIDGAWVNAYESDKNILHPRHVMPFGITGRYTEDF